MELDFSRQLHFWWALLPEIVLCVWGMVVLVAGVSGKHKKAGPAVDGDPSFAGGADLGWLALVGVLLAGMANGWLYGVTEVGRTSMIAIDGFRLFANWVFLIAAALSILHLVHLCLPSAASGGRVLRPDPARNGRDDVHGRRPGPDRHLPRARGDVDRRLRPHGVQPPGSEVRRGRPEVFPPRSVLDRLLPLRHRARLRSHGEHQHRRGRVEAGDGARRPPR